MMVNSGDFIISFEHSVFVKSKRGDREDSERSGV